MKKCVYIPLILAIFVLYGIDAKSGDCSSVNSLITNEINDFEVQFNHYGAGSIANVDFKFRPATPTHEGIISIDWNSLTGTHPAMNEKTIKDFVLNAILRKMGRDYGTTTPMGWGVYSTTSCYSTLNCVIKVDTTKNNCCDNLWEETPLQTWQINGEKFMSIPFAKYICSIKCCKSYFTLKKVNTIRHGNVYPIIYIERDRTQDQVISECSPDSNVVAPHCLLSSDSTSPYYQPWDPNPKSSTCEGGCP